MSRPKLITESKIILIVIQVIIFKHLKKFKENNGYFQELHNNESEIKKFNLQITHK